MQRCAACRTDFREGEQVQRVPPLEVVLRGEKSGALGIYPVEEIPSDDHDIIHNDYKCYEMYFSPLDNPFLYDSITKQMGEDMETEVREEMREEFAQKFEEVKEMISEQRFNFCVDCWAELQEDEPPVCLWCKSPDYVWMHQKPQGMIFCCSRCNKYWDDSENEIDPPGR